MHALINNWEIKIHANNNVSFIVPVINCVIKCLIIFVSLKLVFTECKEFH